MKKFHIRTTKPADIPFLKPIIDDNQMFPSDMLAEMINPFFTDPDCDEFWLICETDRPIAVAYCAQEKMTEGTWNLLLIAVDIPHQGKGVGKAMMDYIECELVKLDVRILLVETSSVPEFAKTRQFYLQCDYKQVATIPEYYAANDDKVVFWKRLAKPEV